MHSLNPKACAIAFGGTLAIGTLLLALISMVHGSYGNTLISILSTVYIGYDNTIPGAVMGGIWAGIDGGIAGYVFALIYNKSQNV
ncbi:MAG TPA: hypothetical protein VJB82_02900 [Candidatus Peribacterales bacterium]|nr:hypothetical protein [Candidatus Peribacterales bacterium]